MTEVFAAATVTLEIPFHDIDIMGIAWHGHYAKYLEIARCEMLETIDYNVEQMQASGYAWPVIDMSIRYAKPLRFRQKIDVVAELVEIEHRMKVKYTISDHDSGERLTRAHTVQVALCMKRGEMLFVSPAVFTGKFA